MPGGLPSALNLYRNEEIKKLWRAGIPAEDIAETFGISKRTVYYITDGVARERMIVVEMERQVDIDELTMRVVNEHGVSLGEMQSKSRVQKIVNARHHLMYLLRTEGDWSLKRIGFAIGGRDHSTCIHGIRAHQKRTE
jgi:chromosomal replication initiation ATPase DnaA